jgi:hypothetical protein
MEFLIKDNGLMEKDKDLVFKYGLMGQNMLANGNRTKPTVKEHFITQMEMFIKENG